MTLRQITFALLLSSMALVVTGCESAPGKPTTSSEIANPESVTDFTALYTANCAACHGDHGKNGAAISLANPVYLATASVADIQRITAAGVSGTMMPGFGKAAGGMLTDRQINILAQGMVSSWSNPGALSGQTPPSYASASHGDPARGNTAYSAYCSRCHGNEGQVASVGLSTGSAKAGPLVDPAYLALISDQGLRSIIIAGQPDQGMPDWRGHANGSQAHVLSDQEITDVVAWLASHRTETPGQPYRQQ
jgi:mono/diheme cytochrome c family protein